MRKILFRGKCKHNGKWMEGYLVELGKESFSDPERYGICNTAIPIFGNAICYNLKIDEVIPETVGQYTGLEDKNGNKIFEGDIVYCKSRLDNANMVVIFECGQFRMVLSENYRSYQTNSGFYDINCFDKEVIGNIHDNPELLKGE